MLITLPEVSVLEKNTPVKIIPIGWELTARTQEDFFTH